jgi:hypothetical protein
MTRVKRAWLRPLWLLASRGGLVLLSLCSWFNVWSVTGARVYNAMSHECHPAWRDYHFGRVRAGDPVDEAIARTNPVSVERRGRWTFLRYTDRGLSFTGMGAAAYDDRMVFACAWSCCWTRLFIDDLTDEQSVEVFGKPKNHPERFGIAPVVR